MGCGTDHECGLTLQLRLARQGNRQAFEQLCGAESVQLWRLAILAKLPGRLRNKVDPDDILQEALHDAWSNLKTLKEVNTQGFHRWILSIAYHRLVDAIRYFEGQKRDISRENGWQDNKGYPDQNTRDTPVRTMARKDHLKQIANILDQLTPAYREMIVYRILEEYSTQEVAERTGKTPEQVSVTLFRALQQMRSIMDQQGIESTIFRLPS